MGMGKGNLWSDSAWAKFVEMWRWYQRVKHLIKPQQRRRQIISAGDGGSGDLRRAKVLSPGAGSGSTITANLLHRSTGVEQTTGDEAGVTVYCNISDPSGTGLGLNYCSRLLDTGDILEVIKHKYDNSGTPEDRWYSVEGFHAFKYCVCTEPAE